MPQIPFPPVVGYGRTNEKTGLTIGNDTNIVSFDNDPATYITGDLVFVCDGTGSDSEFQFIGPVTSYSAGGIVTKLYTNSDKGTSAKLWQLTVGFQFEQNFDSPAIRTRSLGVNTQVTKGGVVWSVQISDPVERLEWRFPKNARAIYRKFRDFIVNSRSDSLDSFAAAYWDFQDYDLANPTTSHGRSKCIEARYAQSQMQFRELVVGTIQDTIPLFVIDSDGYVES